MSASETKNSKEHLNAAEKLIERMKVYSGFRPDQVPEYRKAFARMIEEFGILRVNSGLTRAIDELPSSFPPAPGEIRKFIPPENAALCGKCDNGWIVLPAEKISDFKARRCSCCMVTA